MRYKAKLLCSCGGKIEIDTTIKAAYDLVTGAYHDIHQGIGHQPKDIMNADVVTIDELTQWASDMRDE